MNLNLFDQFASPSLIGIPLFLLALIIPTLLLTRPSVRLVSNRLFTAQSWFFINITKQLFSEVKLTGYKWALLFTSLIIFLLFINLLGLLPHTFTPTTQLSVNMSFAVPFWLSSVILGMRNQPTKSLAHFLPEGTPTVLIPALIIIETISLFIRPLALGVRLTANLTAGHLLIQLIASAALALSSMTLFISIITTSVLFILTVLEIAVAVIQAYVFVLLLTLYLQENT
uniref:ATP synthase subunit a n=1 Tax=Oreolalax lichuanensis TaxID=265046 RepID=A0A342L0T6_ORELI|nr:ATP synthase F0 subunit 6 [Oreolalax lichuanensis]ANN35998.1 ATP synthase F0 subunit 6 [Oreolalax lichuanensis]